MAIKIDPISVKSNLTNYANTYPDFHKALKKANDTFNSLNTYWTGDRYKKIMQAWNKVVPDLNKQLKVLAESSKVLNTILKNYTTADTNAINVQAANVLTLTTCNISNKQEINFDNAKLLSDLQKVSSAISDAKSHAAKMKTFNNNAQWSGEGAIDKARSDVNSALDKIDASLSSLSTDVNKVLKDTSTDFEKAKNSYK